MRTLSLLLLASVLCTAGESASLDRHPWSAAFELRSRHFVVQTNTFPEVARSLSERLEEAYVLFQDRFGVLNGPAARRMRVNLYRTTQEYMTLGDGVKGAIGHFDTALDRCAIAWRGKERATGWPIAIHEACHHYFRRRFPHLAPPSWYAEGIACYFEGLQDESAQGGVSRLRLHTAQAALADGQAALAKLLGARARVLDGELRISSFTPVRYYALSWSLIHFLSSDARYRKRFRRFELRLFNSPPFSATQQGYATRLLVEECGDLESIERHWHRHLARLTRPRAPRVPPVYVWELDSDHAWVRYAALERLTGQGEPGRGLLAGLRRCLRDPDLVVRTAAARIQESRTDAFSVAAMREALDLGDPGLKRIALRSLAHPAAKQAVPRLLRETKELGLALEALAGIGDPRGYVALRTGVLNRDLSAATRARCAAALGHAADDLVFLRLATSDPERSVRNAARAALIRLGRDEPMASEQDVLLRYMTDQRIDTLIERLRSAVPDAAKAQACALLGLGRARKAVPTLRRLCAAEHGDTVRLAAARALIAITGETRGFLPGQPAREREAALRRWAAEG